MIHLKQVEEKIKARRIKLYLRYWIFSKRFVCAKNQCSRKENKQNNPLFVSQDFLYSWDQCTWSGYSPQRKQNGFFLESNCAKSYKIPLSWRRTLLKNFGSSSSNILFLIQRRTGVHGDEHLIEYQMMRISITLLMNTWGLILSIKLKWYHSLVGIIRLLVFGLSKI